jgi:hypothetical protein
MRPRVVVMHKCASNGCFSWGKTSTDTQLNSRISAGDVLYEVSYCSEWISMHATRGDVMKGVAGLSHEIEHTGMVVIVTSGLDSQRAFAYTR